MRIGILGGDPADAPRYREIAARMGHVVAEGEVDLLIVITDSAPVSAVHEARRAARRRGVPVMLYGDLGLARFAAIVAGLTPRLAVGVGGGA